MKDKIETLQEICNELYAKQGLTDGVLDLQIAINKLRHKHNISDEKNRVFPLLYKDVKIHQFQKDNKNPKISIDIYQSNQCFHLI